jgi:predicted signal transduction protein with EAL and GGDEF domain
MWRRYLVILLDLGVASFLTAHFSAAGIAFYPLFLWVMIGNGLRYGQHYMQVATLFGLLGFSGAMASSGFLWAQPATYIGLMTGLVLMPKFFMAMIERLFACVGRYYSIGEQETYVTWSCGVVVYPRDGNDIHTLLKDADTAMYAAKSRGPNHYAFYDAAMSSAVGDLLALRDELRQAVQREQVEVHFQPIVDAQDGHIVAAEVLVRWRHPEKGLLGPGGFIEVSEQSGLINPIGERVLREALRVAARWQAQAGYPVSMHVNISAHQLKQDGFVAQVQALLAESGLSPSRLDLEITESILPQDAERAEQLLAMLKDLGVKIALDDFGTGFSS